MSEESAVVVRTEGVTKSFGTLEILKGITMEVRKGEIVAIVGASGAGKTTLLQILGSLDTPTSGKVWIEGQSLYDMAPKEQADFRNQRLGFVFQAHQLLPEFNALENVALPALIRGDSSREATARATQLLSEMGLADRLTHRPTTLSGGEKQRVAVARALINRPALILADEPTGALDSENKEELHRLFGELRDREGQTIIIVSHDPDITKIADRTIHLQDGRVLE